MRATSGFATVASATRSVARHRQLRWLAKPTLAKLSLARMIAATVLRQTESLVTVPELLERSHENNVVTRQPSMDRLDR